MFYCIVILGEYIMNFELTKVEEKDKEIIFNLMQLYTYELSFYADESTEFEMQENGLYKMSKYVDLYWKEENRNPYLLTCDGKIAGFVLQRFNEENMQEIGEFFVLNEYRKNGAGAFMANKMFDMYKGKWEIRTLLKNERAQSFWRKVVKNASNDNYTEKLIRDNTRYAFYFNN